MEPVRLLCDFPGANPRDPGMVVKTAPGAFVVRPFSEEDFAAYRFRLDVRVEVLTEQAEVSCTVDWDEPEFQHLRRWLYVSDAGGSGRWVQGTPASDRADTAPVFHLELERGVHHLTLNPRYDLEDLARLEDWCRECGSVEIRRFHFAAENPPITAFCCSRPGHDRRTVLAVARIHPYETAGSYCLDGLIRALARQGDVRDRALQRRNWIVIPVMSSAGVAKGFCRLNGFAGSGLDLGRQWSPEDPACRAVETLLDEVRIEGYLDIHNWMHPHRDGLRYVGRYDAFRFRRRLRRTGAVNNPWRSKFKAMVLADEATGLMGRVKRRTRALCLALEFPWHGRTEHIMRELGVDAALAFEGIL